MSLSDPVLSAILIAFIPNVLPRGHRGSGDIPIRTVIAFELQLLATAVILGTTSNLVFVAIIPISSVVAEIMIAQFNRPNDNRGYFLKLLAAIAKLVTALVIAGHPKVVSGFGPMILLLARYAKEHNSIAASVSAAQLHASLIMAVC
jgi:hypothetical protein